MILRNKFFIILYRGKDFLPGNVANSILDRETEIRDQQVQEEEARSKAIKLVHAIDESTPRTSNTGTFSEFQNIKASYHPMNGGLSTDKIKVEAEKEKLEKELRDEEHKLLILNLKIGRSEKELAVLNSSCSPSELSSDQELLTEEERETYKRIGLKMDELLLLGRRGIYDGVIESIHQHWKHREVVKVMTLQKAFHHITYTARSLEIESGGVLVAVEKLGRGHAIIIYRGKNYSRLLKAPPENLLTKREALQRSIEVQRRGSMKYFAWQKQRRISGLKQRLRYLEQKNSKS